MHFPVALSLLVISASTAITAAPSDSTFTSVSGGLGSPPTEKDCWFTLEAFDHSEGQGNFTTVTQSDDGTLLLGGGSPVAKLGRKKNSMPNIPSLTLWDDKSRKCHNSGGRGKQLTCNKNHKGDREYLIKQAVVRNGTSEWSVPILVGKNSETNHFYDCPIPGIPGVRQIFEKSDHFLCKPVVLVPRPRESSTPCACKKVGIFEPKRETQQVFV
ncbi:hypothetical protein CkaCkLH20_01769 [Colletotrichum karsti]|uniref:Uncharacterized protein n=1 Tax=Colletotrichum karsti TaxID=1095194 RepID=A0A9P6LQH4_9PEZI|nr:uncharacterized protein CkaCkLH20_01769 [Colletotrichum karsti]KAF9880727.1 hypothetical protein CkaCkLH20_01769 [Colletotrichum karsti]